MDALSDEHIVTTALQLIRRDGAERLSMRKLAKELGVTPMAIYYYLPNKDALFGRLADEVLGRVPRPAPSGSAWRNELHAYAVGAWQMLREYPGLSAHIIRLVPGAQSEALTAYGVSILVAAGLDAATASLAINSYHAFLIGVVEQEAQLARMPRRKRKGGPTSSYLQQLDFRELVDFGVEALLNGLSERLRSQRRLRPARTRVSKSRPAPKYA